MKKILITILASFALAGVAQAGSFGVGVSGGVIQVEGSGNEKTTAGTVAGGSANTSVNQDVNAASVIGSVFAEYEFDNGFALGFEHVPGSADVSDKHSRRDVSSEDAAGAGTSGDTLRTAQASVDNFNTLYLEAPLGPAYVRLGYSEITVSPSAKNSHGTYADFEVDGITYGFGVKGSLGSFVTKTSIEHTDFDSFSIKSSTGNTIAAELDTTQLKFALLKQF
jgi:hypothetical protein